MVANKETRASKQAQAKTLAEASKTFEDSMGRKWTPVLDTITVVEACRHLNLTLKMAMDVENLNIGDLIDLIWFACRKQAQERKMTYEDFMGCLTFAVIPKAFESIGVVLVESFPNADDIKNLLGDAGKKGPFENGS